jgi:hypothetical protein
MIYVIYAQKKAYMYTGAVWWSFLNISYLSTLLFSLITIINAKLLTHISCTVFRMSIIFVTVWFFFSILFFWHRLCMFLVFQRLVKQF